MRRVVKEVAERGNTRSSREVVEKIVGRDDEISIEKRW